MAPELPESPVGEAVRWVIDVVAAGTPVTEADVVDRFAPAFVQSAGAAELRDFLGVEVRKVAAGATVEAVDAPSPLKLDALLSSGSGAIRIHLVVSPAAGHPIIGLSVVPHDPAASDAPRHGDLKTGPERVSPTLGDAAAALVDRSVAAMVDDLRLVGVAATVIHPAGVHHVTAGAASLDPRRPWTPATVHRIGSVGKTMTAVGVLQLVEEGHLALDSRATDHLERIDLDPRITVEHLLTHSSGLETDATTGMAGDENLISVPDLLADGFRGAFEPGQGEAYSNVGFALLGQLLAEVSGQSFADRLAASVFEPLGMTSTVVGEKADARGPLAVGCSVLFDEVSAEPWIAVTMPGAGAMLSTPDDGARWMQMLVGRGANEHGRVLQPETFDLLVMGGPDVGEQATRGRGIVVVEVAGRRLLWHNGGWLGYSTSMWVAPDDGWGVFLCTNTDNRTGGGDDLDRAGHDLLLALVDGASP